MSLTVPEVTGCAAGLASSSPCAVAAFTAAKNQSHVCLELLSKKFEKEITDERDYRGDLKICSGKNISDCPSYASLLPHPRMLKFSHQEIGTGRR